MVQSPGLRTNGGTSLNVKFIREVGPLRFLFRTAVRQTYKRILKRSHKMRLPNGAWMVLPISSRFATEAYITGGDVDWGSERLLDAMIDGGGAFLDIGANIGYYSLYFAPKALAVYSFEPDPRVRAVLERSTHENPKIHVLPYAVGATQGKASFVLEGDPEVSHLSMDGETSGDRVDVDLITVDAFAAAQDLQIEAIKIDVEGHDQEVIRGASKTLGGQMPIVLAEAEPNAELFRMMAEIDYRVFAYVRHPETRRRHFAELLPDVPTGGETKMLFLVPPRLVERIQKQGQLL